MLPGKGLLDKLGAVAVADIQHEMRRLYKPGDAPMTIDNKGFNNPLIGKHAGGQGGALINKITYKIIPEIGGHYEFLHGCYFDVGRLRR
ncbi:hypothetical protein ABVC46_02715 [Lactobacillus crispatus]|uniref:hypothetical protein n=1 Tax=Lactobacillus crispatus TaxID=47770 RepID=UPI00336A63E4